VYVATGDVVADGLAGGAVVSQGGDPMVMVPLSGELPAGVRITLAQLRPSRIVVLGGAAAIARDIENAVATYLP
jgi:putative cell wall-binding protein